MFVHAFVKVLLNLRASDDTRQQPCKGHTKWTKSFIFPGAFGALPASLNRYVDDYLIWFNRLRDTHLTELRVHKFFVNDT